MTDSEEISGKDLPYTNREQREWRHDTANSLQRIELQTTKTNGSVADLNRWRERMNGGAMVAGVFMTIVVMPILCWAIYVLVNLPHTIDDSVQKALQAYDIVETK